MSAAAVRNSSRRRTPRAAVTACTAPSARRTAASVSLLQLEPPARRQPADVAVPEQCDGLGRPHQQVGASRPADSTRARFSAAAPRPAAAAGTRASCRARRRPCEVEQAGVRVGRVGEPAEQHGKQGPLDGRLAGDAGRQRLQVPERGGRIGVPEGDHPLPRRLWAQPGLAGRQLGDGVEQRPVEQLLVQPAYDGRVPLPRAQQPGDRVGAQAEGAAETTQVGLVLGDEVGAPQPVELDAVLHGTQESGTPRRAGRRPPGPRTCPRRGTPARPASYRCAGTCPTDRAPAGAAGRRTPRP